MHKEEGNDAERVGNESIRVEKREVKGVSNGHKNFQLLAKFGPCSICSQNLDECSLARARKIFAIPRMFGFSLKFARFLKIL